MFLLANADETSQLLLLNSPVSEEHLFTVLDKKVFASIFRSSHFHLHVTVVIFYKSGEIIKKSKDCVEQSVPVRLSKRHSLFYIKSLSI